MIRRNKDKHDDVSFYSRQYQFFSSNKVYFTYNTDDILIQINAALFNVLLLIEKYVMQFIPYKEIMFRARKLNGLYRDRNSHLSVHGGHTSSSINYAHSGPSIFNALSINLHQNLSVIFSNQSRSAETRRLARPL